MCLSVFFSATAEPFALKFAMVFRNSAGKILSKFLGPMIEYFPSYDIIKGLWGGFLSLEIETSD